MTPRERILTALRRRQPDRLPWMFGTTQPVRDLLRAKIGASDAAEHYNFDFREIGIKPSPAPTDFTPFYRGRTFSGPARIDSDWGYALVAQAPETPFLNHWESPFADRAFTAQDARDYPIPDLDNPARYTDVQRENDRWHAKGYATRSVYGFCTFDLSWLVRGYEEFLMDMAQETEASQILMDRVSEAVAAHLKHLAARGTDIVGFGEDVGNQNALMMSPRLWRSQIKPRFARIVRAAKAANPDVLFFYHSDGQIEEIIPDLIEIGVDILNPVQPECMDPAAIKRKYGGRLAFWGAVGTQTTMPHDTPEQVRACVHTLFETVGKGGGFVCAPSHVLEPEVPWENIEAFVDACRECMY